MKRYITPTSLVRALHTEQIIAASVGFSNKPADSSYESLTRQQSGWSADSWTDNTEE